jgi:hypothetical protein
MRLSNTKHRQVLPIAAAFLIALVLGGGVLLAACGGGGDGTSTTTQTPGGGTSATTQTPGGGTGTATQAPAGGTGTATHTPGGSGQATATPTEAGATPAETDGSGGVEIAACELLSDDEASQALNGNTTGMPVDGSCLWYGDAGMLGIVVIDTESSGAGFKGAGQILYGEIQDVSGLGDEAYWAPNAEWLYVRKGSIEIAIMAPGLGLDLASGVAQKALDRLSAATHPIP